MTHSDAGVAFRLAFSWALRAGPTSHMAGHGVLMSQVVVHHKIQRPNANGDNSIGGGGFFDSVETGETVARVAGCASVFNFMSYSRADRSTATGEVLILLILICPFKRPSHGK